MDYEDLVVIGRVSKKVVWIQRHSKIKLEATSNKRIIEALKYKDKIVIHNHPSNLSPSGSDLVSNFENVNELGVVVCHDGEIFVYKTMEQFTTKIFDLSVKKHMDSGYNMPEAYDKALNDFEKKVVKVEKTIYERLDEKYENRGFNENDNPVDLSEFTPQEIELLIEREERLMKKNRN